MSTDVTLTKLTLTVGSLVSLLTHLLCHCWLAHVAMPKADSDYVKQVVTTTARASNLAI